MMVVSQLYFDMNASKVAEEVGNLLFYASKGDVAGIQTLLDQGMPVDAADYDGRTALHLAASEGHAAVVNFLLKNNADVNPIDRNGDTVCFFSPHYLKLKGPS